MPLACVKVSPDDQRPPVERETRLMPHWLSVTAASVIPIKSIFMCHDIFFFRPSTVQTDFIFGTPLAQIRINIIQYQKRQMTA